VKQADLREMFKETSKSVCASTVWYLLTPCLPVHQPCGISWHLVFQSINVFSYEDPENTKEDPDDPKPADEEDIQIEHSSISCTIEVQDK